FCTTTVVRGSLRNLGRIGDRGTSSGTWPAAWAPTGMVFPDLREEARKAPEFVEVARPIHQGRPEPPRHPRRHPTAAFRATATNTSSTPSSDARRRRQTTSAAASPPAAAIAAQVVRSAGTGGGGLVGGLTNSMSIRGPVTVAG